MGDTFILAHDIGTTGSKSCIYRIRDCIELVEAALVEYPLYVLPNGGVEQQPDDWWNAICQATRTVLERSGIPSSAIAGMVFCAQMQGFIAVDSQGCALRPAMSYMDGRSTAQIEKHLYNGLIRINKWNAYKTLRSLMITGGMAATVKDPLWKYHWLHENEPHIFEQMHAWMDVKDYLVLRSTGVFSMGYDSAHATFVFDTRLGKLGWHKGLCRMFGVNMEHLPPLVNAIDVVGTLTQQAAQELGLPEGLPVFGGGR